MGIDWASVPDSYVATCMCGDPGCTALSEPARITTNKTGGITIVNGATSPDSLEITAHAVAAAPAKQELCPGCKQRRDDCRGMYTQRVDAPEHRSNDCIAQEYTDNAAPTAVERRHMDRIKRELYQSGGDLLTGFRSMACKMQGRR